MVNEIDRHYGEGLEKATAVATETRLSHDTFTAMVAQMVAQCGALLRQQLEHKAKGQPLLYDKQRVERIMREFQAGAEDIQDAIAARVMSRLTHHVQQEVLRVLDDALSDATYSLEDPLWDQDNAWRHAGWVQKPDREAPAIADAPPQEPEPAPQEHHQEELEVVAPVAQPIPEPPSFADVQAQPPKADGLTLREGPAPALTSEIYEGTVKLRVEATDSFRQVIQFVEALRQKSELRLLKLVGGFENGVDIWVGLRAPLALKQVLLDMEGISAAETPDWLHHDASEPLINVTLARPQTPK